MDLVLSSEGEEEEEDVDKEEYGRDRTTLLSVRLPRRRQSINHVDKKIIAR